MNEFSDNDDDHIPQNSKSYSHLEKMLGSYLNPKDTIADEGETTKN